MEWWTSYIFNMVVKNGRLGRKREFKSHKMKEVIRGEKYTKTSV